MTTQFYTLFDKIPKLPEHLILEAQNCVRPDNMTQTNKGNNRVPVLIDYSLPDDQAINGVTYHRYNASASIIEWVTENIHEKLIRPYLVGIQLFNHKLPGQVITSGPHVDGPRGDYVLNYCLEPGGDNVLTQWFQQDGFEVIRHQAHQTGLYLKTFDGLTKIQEVKCPVKEWHGLEIRALHTVANLTSNRLALSLGIPQDILPDIINRFK